MLVGPKKNPVEILTPEDIAKLPQQEQHKWEIAAELGGMLAAAQRKKK